MNPTFGTDEERLHFKYFQDQKKYTNNLEIWETRRRPSYWRICLCSVSNRKKIFSSSSSLIKEFSARFSHVIESLEILKFLLYLDVMSFDKLISVGWNFFLEMEFEMQLLYFQSSSIWNQKFVETGKELEIILLKQKDWQVIQVKILIINILETCTMNLKLESSQAKKTFSNKILNRISILKICSYNVYISYILLLWIKYSKYSRVIRRVFLSILKALDTKYLIIY